LLKIAYASGLTGFIGRNFISNLQSKYDLILNFSRNKSVQIYNKDNCVTEKYSKSILSKYPSEIFFNLATYYQPLPEDNEDLKALINANIFFSLNILEDILSFNSDVKIVNTSSYMQLLPICYQNQYSLSKEIFLKNAESKIKNIHNIYLFDSFGIGDTRNKIVDVFISRILTGESISIPSNEVTINLSQVKDICLSLICSDNRSFGNYCIQSPFTLSLEDLAKMLMEIIGNKVKIVRNNPVKNLYNEIKVFPENIFISNRKIDIYSDLKYLVNDHVKANYS